jgi:hypothetical protein
VTSFMSEREHPHIDPALSTLKQGFAGPNGTDSKPTRQQCSYCIPRGEAYPSGWFAISERDRNPVAAVLQSFQNSTAVVDVTVDDVDTVSVVDDAVADVVTVNVVDVAVAVVDGVPVVDNDSVVEAVVAVAVVAVDLSNGVLLAAGALLIDPADDNNDDVLVDVDADVEELPNTLSLLLLLLLALLPPKLLPEASLFAMVFAPVDTPPTMAPTITSSTPARFAT